MSLTSNATRFPNVPPYNTFSLTCTATVPEGVVSPKAFMWWRQNSILNTFIEEFQISNKNLDQETLVVTETTAGIWQYSCEVVIPELSIVSNRSNTYHSINVTGKFYFCIAYVPLFDSTESSFLNVYASVCAVLYSTSRNEAPRRAYKHYSSHCHNQLSHHLLECNHLSLHPRDLCGTLWNQYGYT